MHVLRTPLAFAFALSTPATAQFNFAPAEVAAPLGAYAELDLVDIDADGDIDVVTAVTEYDFVVLENDGTGQFTEAFSTTDVEGNGQATAVGDIDADGDLDIVCSSGALLSVFWNDGGTFVAGPTTAAGSYTEEIALADLDGDGNLDVALANWATESMSVLTGDGTGAFSGEVFYPQDTKAFDVIAADLNGDGWPDLVVSDYGDWMPTDSGFAHVFLNLGGGVLAPKVSYPSGRGTMTVRAVDNDLDGDLDLLTTNRNTFDLSVLENLGDGTFAPEAKSPIAGQYPKGGSPGDFDGDGDPDVVVPVGGASTLRVFKNDGEGGLAVEMFLQLSSTLVDSATADLDNDGDIDFLVAAGSGGLLFFENEEPQINPFLLKTNHLVAGQPAQFDVLNAEAGEPVALFVSVTGAGVGPVLPGLGIEFGILDPLLLLTATTDAEGRATWGVGLAPGVPQVELWLQAVRVGGQTGVVGTQIN